MNQGVRLLIIGVVILLAGVAVFLVFRGQMKESNVPQPSSDIPSEEENGATGELLNDPRFANDKDGDGIPNEEETRLGTSETDFDTDGDGISDADEINVWKTDPTNTDTDGDGFSDGLEILRGYNPAGDGSLPEPAPSS